MKRNYDLIRDILLAVEQQPAEKHVVSFTAKDFRSDYPELTSDTLNSHIELLVDNALLVGDPCQFGWFITKITWKGHDFLDASRVESVWQKAKKYAGHYGFDLFWGAVKDAAAEHIKTQIVGG